MKRGWLVATVIFFALFCFTTWQSLKLPQMDDLGPGPGFFPFWLSLIGGILSLLLALETVRLPSMGDGSSLIPDRSALYRILAIVIVLAAAAAALDPLGWRLTALLFSAILLPALGVRSVLTLIPFAVAAGFGVFHVFYYWLKVPLPIGMFGI